MTSHPGDVTRLLQTAAAGDQASARQIFELLYDEFHRAAEQAMQQRDSRGNHTLQPTALVHEMFLRLEGGQLLAQATNRRHLFGIALRAYEQILVDHSRARAARKRGGDRQRVPWDEVLDSLESRERVTMDDLQQALLSLDELDPAAAAIVRRKFYWNQEHGEIADDLQLDSATVARKWRTARAWLLSQLDHEA